MCPARRVNKITCALALLLSSFLHLLVRALPVNSPATTRFVSPFLPRACKRHQQFANSLFGEQETDDGDGDRDGDCDSDGSDGRLVVAI